MLMNSSHRTESVYVVFVCSGNICRSPMAEIIVRDAVEANALADDVLLASCGIGGWHVGEPADERAQAELENAGYDPNHTAAQLGDEHMDATLFIAMDESHINGLLHAGVPKEKIRLMRSFDPASPKGPSWPILTTEVRRDSSALETKLRPRRRESSHGCVRLWRWPLSAKVSKQPFLLFCWHCPGFETPKSYSR